MFLPQGFLQVCRMYLNDLLTRKTVALFSNFDEARTDILGEYQNRLSPETYKNVAEAIKAFEEICDTKDYFEEI